MHPEPKASIVPAAGSGLKVRDTICGICPAGCWLTAELESGRLARVRAQEDHPLGMICRLGEHAPEIDRKSVV